MEFRIDEIEKNKYVIYKKVLHIETKGFLWWKKTIEKYRWYYLTEHYGTDVIIFDSLLKAEDYLKFFLEFENEKVNYPKTIKYIEIENYGK